MERFKTLCVCHQPGKKVIKNSSYEKRNSEETHIKSLRLGKSQVVLFFFFESLIKRAALVS